MPVLVKKRKSSITDPTRKRLTLAAFGLLLVSAGCSVQTVQLHPASPFASHVGPVVIAHRGGSLEAPENTLASIRHGVEAGSHWQEIDVTMSADEVVVVIHDDTLERTTNGAGEVLAQPLSELKKLETGRPAWTEEARARLATYGVTPPDFGDRFASESVPTLAEALAVEGSRLMVEVKRIEPDRVDTLAERVLKTVREAQAEDRVILGSFDPAILWALHDRDPSIPLIGVAGTSEELNAMVQLPVVVLAVRLDLISEASELVTGKTALWGWTAYTPDMANQAVVDGAHGVITDVPEAVMRAFSTPPDPVISMP